MCICIWIFWMSETKDEQRFNKTNAIFGLGCHCLILSVSGRLSIFLHRHIHRNTGWYLNLWKKFSSWFHITILLIVWIANVCFVYTADNKLINCRVDIRLCFDPVQCLGSGSCTCHIVPSAAKKKIHWFYYPSVIPLSHILVAALCVNHLIFIRVMTKTLVQIG